MALNFWKWLAGGKARSPTTVEITCRELMAAAQEFQLRDLAFWTCANMIANAVARCEFRTFRGGKEIQEREHPLKQHGQVIYRTRRKATGDYPLTGVGNS